MKRKVGIGMFAIVLAVLWAIPVLAGPPTNPNGFPSGTHHNLNIIGKKVGFNGCDILCSMHKIPKEV